MSLFSSIIGSLKSVAKRLFVNSVGWMEVPNLITALMAIPATGKVALQFYIRPKASHTALTGGGSGRAAVIFYIGNAAENSCLFVTYGNTTGSSANEVITIVKLHAGLNQQIRVGDDNDNYANRWFHVRIEMGPATSDNRIYIDGVSFARQQNNIAGFWSNLTSPTLCYFGRKALVTDGGTGGGGGYGDSIDLMDIQLIDRSSGSDVLIATYDHKDGTCNEGSGNNSLNALLGGNAQILTFQH